MVAVLDISIQQEASLRALQHALAAVQPASLALFMEGTVDPIIRKRMASRFASQGDDAVGGPWLPLSATTVTFRESQGFPGSSPINHRTGEMKNWLDNADADIHFFGPGAEYVYPGETPSDRWLAVKLETAAKGKAKPNTPARPVIGISENDHRMVREALGLYLAAAMQ